MTLAQTQSLQRGSGHCAERRIAARAFRGFAVVFQRDHRTVERPTFGALPVGLGQVGRCTERFGSCLVEPCPRRDKVHRRIAGSRQAPVDHSHQPTVVGQQIVGFQIAMQPDRGTVIGRRQSGAPKSAGLDSVDLVREAAMQCRV